MRHVCSCGRVEVEHGCDLCAYCRDDYERVVEEREDDERNLPDEDFYIRDGARG